MTHYLRLNSLVYLITVMLFCSCGNPYRKLQETAKPEQSVLRYKPVFDKKIYRCVVNGKFLFKKFHLSGILFFKTMPDRGTRVVFQNEMGFAFFDFEWTKQGDFTVKQIIPQMNKPPLIKVLRKDLELLLMKQLDKESEKSLTNGNEDYHRFTLSKGYVYYVTDKEKLVRIENAGKRKKVAVMSLGNKESAKALPDSVFIKHYKAHFTIDLKKIDHADQ
ncbi:hypothetical protein ACTHGU_04345 [Chitinophagaceae bacterium MMS25-I14]